MTAHNTRRLDRILRALEELGARYVSEFLAPDWDCRRLKADWFYAFKFFAYHMYFQGRRDEVSNMFFERMWQCLHSAFHSDADAAMRALWEGNAIPHTPDWKYFSADQSPLWRAFTPQMGKERDREMILDLLRYVHSVPCFNVVAHSLERIGQNEIETHRQELQGLWQVGPKTSAFYLRDICFLFQPKLRLEQLIQLQPVDTWVKQVRELADTDPDDRSLSDEEWFARHASQGYDASRLNAGAWYLGKHGFRIALHLLGRVEVPIDALQELQVRH